MRIVRWCCSVAALMLGFTLVPAPASQAWASVPDVVAADETLQDGDRGPDVRALQERLVALRYYVGGVDGVYGYLTTQAVMAFQKVNGLTRDGVARPEVQAALDDPIRPQARTSARRALEVAKDAQVVLLVRNGRVRRIFNASTGTATTPTPRGRFRVTREIDGWHTSPLGPMYRPKYFYEGYAVHGSTSVPAYPASHGCVRLNVRSADFLWDRVPVGTRVRIVEHLRTDE